MRILFGSSALRSSRRDYTLQTAVISFLLWRWSAAGTRRGKRGEVKRVEDFRRRPRGAEVALRRLVPLQLEAPASVARERFSRVGRASAQLRESQIAHARTSSSGLRNCAIVYDLPSNLEPRAACLDSRVFGGNRGTLPLWILREIGVDTVLPRRGSGGHIGACGPCAIAL